MSNNSSTRPTSNPQNTYNQPHMTAMMMSSNLNGDTNWYHDSGATNHITHNMSNQISAVKLLMGNKYWSGMLITQSGQSSLVSSSNHVFHLRNQLHVPTITKNLLRVSQFAKEN